MRREPLLAALLCVAGAFLVLVAVGRPWVLAGIDQSALLPTVELGVTGRDLRPGLAALGLVGLAGVPALAASRGRGRIVVGLLLALTGLAVVAVLVQLALADRGLVAAALDTEAVRQAGGREGVSGEGTPWPAVTAVGGVLLALAGLLVAARGRRWAALGRSYEPPVTGPDDLPVASPAGVVAERELWAALDRGEDPTGGVAEQSSPDEDPPASATEVRD